MSARVSPQHKTEVRLWPVAGVQERIKQLEHMLSGSVGPTEQGRVLSILRQASDGDFNTILSRIDLVRLNAFMREDSLALSNDLAYFKLLSETRLGAMSVATKALWVDALQRVYTDAPAERAIAAVFLGTQGQGLTELKNRVDAGDDQYDLQELVHHDIDNKNLRRQMLTHIAGQATLPVGASVKILSDVDDTVFSSIHDERVAKGTTYPGIVAFYRALARPPGEGRSNLTFLSARPRDPLGVVENYTKHRLRQKNMPEHALLTGDVFHWLGHAHQAKKKIENFVQYQALFPEYGFIFFGDSGQGDPIVARTLLEKHVKHMVAAFIHDLGNLSRHDVRQLEEQGVICFKNYVAAAIVAYDRGLISRQAVLDVAKSAEQASTEAFDPAYTTLLRQDIDRARTLAAAA
ncbi:MAG: phosphatase domain-containing protein [Myxococcota bacterium]